MTPGGATATRPPRACLTRRDALPSGTAAAAAGLFGALRPALEAAAESIRRGGALRAALEADAPSPDPDLSSAAVGRRVFQSLFDKVSDTDADLRIVPMLAASWSISSDATVYTLRHYSSAGFQDGTPFDAQAVV